MKANASLIVPALVALLAGACAETTPPDESPDDVEAMPWPCGSNDPSTGTATTMTWDAQHRITYQRVRWAGALQREMWTDYDGDIAVREETVESDGNSSYIERDVSGGRIVRARSGRNGSVDVVEDYVYVDGELDRITGAMTDGRGYEWTVYRPSPDAETRAFHWLDSPNVTYIRTRAGGERWTLETIGDPSPATRHVRTFDAAGWLVAEEKRSARGDDALLLQRDITRRADGAPLWEYVTTPNGLSVITYLFECSDAP